MKPLVPTSRCFETWGTILRTFALPAAAYAGQVYLASAAMTVGELRCEYEVNPMGHRHTQAPFELDAARHGTRPAPISLPDPGRGHCRSFGEGAGFALGFGQGRLRSEHARCLRRQPLRSGSRCYPLIKYANLTGPGRFTLALPPSLAANLVTNTANSSLDLNVTFALSLTPTNLVVSAPTGNTLNVSWPDDHRGWQLETNSVGVTATNQWFPYPGSTAVTSETITITRNKLNVFFRLVYPPR